MKQYEMYELVFQGEEPQGSQVAVDVNAIFSCNGEEKIVKGFYAGDGIYKIRFYPMKEGEYSWKVTGEVQLYGTLEGTEMCKKEIESGKGMVRAVGTHFEYDSGGYYYPFGTTVYALAHQENNLIEETFQTLSTAPFNKVRHCVFPKHYDYNNNEPQFYPFEKNEDGKWDVNHPCFAFWEHLEEIIRKMGIYGIQSDLILFHPYDNWGFAELSREENLIYLDYVIRRFSAIPEIWWSLSNEFDLCYHKNMEDWYAFETFVAENDSFGHLLSNHNCFSFYDFKRPTITHCSMQSNQMMRASQWIEEYGKPIVYDEVCYEGNLPQNWGNISGFELTNRFWIACVQGAYVTHGEVFLSEDDILWWSKGGNLKGQSSSRIAFLRSIIEEIGAPLETWETNPLEGMDEEMIQKILNSPLALLPGQMPLDQQEAHLFTDAAYRGHVGEQIFIQYLGIHCNAMLDWSLPETGKYDIEIIDVWEMTRKKVMYNVSGKIRVNLPGKEGIAVLAKRVEDKKGIENELL